MELRPTRPEARLIAVCLLAFWVTWLLIAVTADPDSAEGSPWLLLPVLIAFAAGITLTVTLLRVAKRETGLGYWGLGVRGRWRLFFRLADPRWYLLAARESGWPTAAVMGAWAAALGADMVAFVVLLARQPR